MRIRDEQHRVFELAACDAFTSTMVRHLRKASPTRSAR
jgi:hypothetical protein